MHDYISSLLIYKLIIRELLVLQKYSMSVQFIMLTTLYTIVLAECILLFGHDELIEILAVNKILS